jgi:hypothetical protein
VRLEEGVAEADLLQVDLVAGQIAAFREPDPLRLAPEVLPVVLRRDVDLRAHGLRHGVHERQEAVGGPAGDDLELPGVAVLAEGAQQVAAVLALEDAAHVLELAVVEAGELGELGLPARGALDLPPRELDQRIEVAQVAADQELVRHHRDERRRERHREPVVDAVAQQAVEHAYDRDVGLVERLEEPVLLEERRVLGMADVRQVRVEYRAPVPDGHGPLPNA